MEEEPISCPFCGYITDSEYQIMLHMETVHPEGGESPFVVRDDASIAAVLSLGEDDVQYACCPVDGCGEAILLTELDSHIEMHGVEEAEEDQEEDADQESGPDLKKPRLEEHVRASFDTKLSHALRNLDDGEKSSSESPPSDRQTSAKAAWKNLLKMPETPPKAKTSSSSNTKAPRSRLGKSELGPHANERQMPSWLVKVLESDGEVKSINRMGEDGRLKRVKVCANQAAGILPVLKQLLNQDPYTEYAYLCHPAVKHVSKLRREGGFCGYRNIQMLCSHIIDVESQGYQHFNGKIPTIFKIQDYIENAWDLGINVQGRAETGGIRGTRKYIGTPDAQAMFCSLDISCDAQGLRTKRNGPSADQMLFEAVESYFVEGVTDFDSKVRLTSLPPIYFQHPGHSMTIVGFEKKQDGSKNLIVFDPMFHDAMHVMRLVDQEFKHKAPADLLRAYRRGLKYLRKYNEFELLKLKPPLSQSGNVIRGTWYYEPSE